jgi:uncharacterized protein (TIGR03437 family)
VIRSIFLLAILSGSLGAQSPPFVMLNAASYANASAPNSLATIFGNNNLAQGTATATPDPSGQLPTELAGTTVEIAGIAAPLFYVSPSQINLVIPAGIDPGTVDVVVRNTASGTSRMSTAFLRAAAPGVFSSDATGNGPGAILNAVTFAPAPFLVQTPENGADTRTRLAIFGTGFRNAQSVSATAQDPTGNRYDLTVEFAGAAPGFIGLDQVNVVLPPDLDGAGTVTLSLGADGFPANPVTVQINLLAVNSLRLFSLAIAPAFVTSGDSATLTVGLNGVARAGGFPVALRSNGAAAQVVQQIVIPAGKAFAQTTVSTLTVAAPVTPLITAQAGTVTLSTPLEIDPANTVVLTAVSLTPASVLGGRNVVGTITLSGPAPSGGINVLISTDNAVARAPAVVNVPFNQSTVGFPITTVAVTQVQTVTLMATLNRTSVTAPLNVLPPLQITVDPTSVVVGGSATGTVTLGESPVTPALINLQSSDGVVRLQPPSVTIPVAQTAQTFTLTTASPLVTTRVVTISAVYLAFKATTTLTVTPQVTAALASIVVSPNPVTSGSIAQGTVTLTAPATAATVVTLFSTAAAAVPSSVTIAQGQSSATFSVTTIRGLTGSATITATLLGVSKSVTLGVQ